MNSRVFTIAALLPLIFLTASVSPVQAQGYDLPEVKMVTDNYDYMISLFGDDVPDRAKALRACSTMVDQAESLKVFWLEQGNTILYYLSLYGGINWVEPEFKIYLVKYFPGYACHDPLTIPLAGRKNGERIEALPQGLSPYLTLFQQLARRLLDQAAFPGGSAYYISGHPLMEKTPRRFDNLANLLALRTMTDFFSPDTVLAMFRSTHWKEREIGQPVLFDYLWDKWKLSGDSTLAERIASEPYDSRLVTLTRTPAAPRLAITAVHQAGPSSEGRLGFSVARDRSGFFRVVAIDTLKFAYKSGLRQDDLIRNVNGAAPRNIKELFSLVLERLDRGAHVGIVRRNEPDAVIIYSWN